MRLPTSLFYLSATATALIPRQNTTIPKPTLTNITYWGSACPENGLSFTLPPPSNTTLSSPLTFSLSNFLPSFGSFGSSLRMCNAVAFVSVDAGWKLRVNAKGTTAKGDAELDAGARMYLRGTWFWAESAGTQSVGMFDVPGPLAGPFSHLITPVEGSDRGVESGCAGAESELDVEFQARAVNDTVEKRVEGTGSAGDARWTLTTDVEVVKC